MVRITRLVFVISLSILAGIGCRYRSEQSGKAVDKADSPANVTEHRLKSVSKSDLLTAIGELKDAVNADDKGSLYIFLPKPILDRTLLKQDEVVKLVSDFFVHLDIKQLTTSDTISRTIVKNGDPCLEILTIGIAADSITFEYRMDKNPDYKMTEKDIAEDFAQSSECEHIMWFNFRILSGKLRLTSFDGAD